MKKNKIVSKLFAGAMAVALCLGTTNVALAAPGDETQDKKVAITKELDIAEGIQTPDVAFTFTFTQDTSSADTTKTEVAINPITLRFTNGDNQTDGMIVKESKNILANVTFPNAGVYKYTVVETAGETTIDNGNGEGTMKYDTTTYTMQIVVKNTDDGTVVDQVVVEKDGGEEGDESNKVEAAPTTDEEEDSQNDDDANGSDSATGNGFRFVNAYTKNGGGIVDPVDPDPDQPDPDPTQSALKITKTVVGDLADRNLGFSFNVNLEIPASSDVETVKGFIYNADGAYVSDADFTNGDNAFTLAHGQYLTFKTLPAGTKYTVTESGTDNYTGATSTVVGGGEAVVVNGEKSATVSTAQSLVGEIAGNSTDVTNTYDDQSVTPTGIIVNNLPYVALILVAVIGCVAIVAGKKRRAN